MGGAVASRRTILVIDDSEVILDLVKEALEDAGHRVLVRSAASGSVNAILRERPDVVLLDVNMPHVTGDAIARIFAKCEGVGTTKVVLHSSMSLEMLRLKAIGTGAHAYIQKTSDLAHLVRKVEELLHEPAVSATGRRARSREEQARAEEDDAARAHRREERSARSR
jgi:DNA-binding response OmpR family regulator